MRIEITTDGGFSGRGIGGVAIEAGEHEDVARALANARVDDWRSEYTTRRGADQIRYTMTVGERVVSWVDGAEIPGNLAALFDAVWAKR